MLCLLSLTLSAQTTFTVTNSNDSGAGSLRDAVASASAGDIIVFGGATNGVPIMLTSGEIDITVPLSIIGNDTTNTVISGMGSSRIFDLLGTGTTVLRRVKLMMGNAGTTGVGAAINTNAGANVEVYSSAIANNTAAGGAGLYVAPASTALVSRSTFYDNTATGDDATFGGAAIYGAAGSMTTVRRGSRFMNNDATGTSGSGGAIFVGDAGMARITTSSFMGNDANRAGGAIEAQSGATMTLEVVSCTFMNNDAGTNPGNGGAVHLSGASNIDIINCTFNGNTAVEGGGIWNATGNMNVRGSNFMMNVASGDDANQGGGAAFNVSGTLAIEGGSMNTNSATGSSGSGGAIITTGGMLRVAGTLFAGNTSIRAGGAIEDVSGSAMTSQIFGATFNGNTTGGSPGNGGAIHLTGDANIGIFASTFSNNIASSEGGGVWNGTGTMTVSACTFNANIAQGDNADNGGGALFNNGGTLLVNRGTSVSGNQATGTSGSGGGLLNLGTATVVQSFFNNNTANRAGGGIEDAGAGSGSLTVRRSDFQGNDAGTAPGNGGGIHITGAGNSTVFKSTFTSNTAEEGGGVWNGSGTMDVVDCTFNLNTATGETKGGGGAFNLSGTLNVFSGTTFTGNQATGASGSGGAILNAKFTDDPSVAAELNVFNVSFTNNTANRAGGAIESAASSATTASIANANFQGNTAGSAPGNGGAIHISGSGNMDISASVFTANIASAEGGAVWNGAGDMRIFTTSFISNEAQGNDADQGGGALFNFDGGDIVVQENCTFLSNTASGSSGSGGAIMNDTDASLTVFGASFSNNSASRAGGAIEDNSGASSFVEISGATFTGNSTGSAPGNGGAIHITGPGDMTIDGAMFMNNTAAAEGGAVWNGAGIMELRNSSIVNNTASGDDATNGGGGLFNLAGVMNVEDCTIRMNDADGTAGSGGGIFNDVGATLNVFRSTINSNTANRAGGGVEDQSGMMGFVRLVDCTIDSNEVFTAPGNGGGVHIGGMGNSLITDSDVRDNTAGNEGGGLWNGAGNMTVRRTNVLRNSAPDGGGLYNVSGVMNVLRSTSSLNEATSGSGGGAFVEGGTLTIDFSTLTANTATMNGGGIANPGGEVFVNGATIAANDATVDGGGIGTMGMARIKSSIVALNTASGSGENLSASGMGSFMSMGWNLIGSDSEDVFAAMMSDMEGTTSSPIDPMVGPLQDNGGPTLTHALMSGSPAIDMGTPSDNRPDQRLMAVFNGQRDIGAFEAQSGGMGTVRLDMMTDTDNGGNDVIEGNSRIYPNPAFGEELNVVVPTSFGDDTEVRIMDVTGRTISLTLVNAGTQQVSLSGLQAGTYVVQVSQGDKAETHKLVVK